MKVLQINAYYSNGSTGMLTKDIHEYNVKNGIDSYVIYGKENNFAANDKNIIRMNNKIGFLFHKYMFNIFGKQWKYSYFKTKKILKTIDNINPDIIHLHNLHDYFINVSLLFKYLKDKKIPVVWTFHDCWAITGHCSSFNIVQCDRWMKHCYDCPMQRKGPKSLIFDHSRKCYSIKKTLFNSIDDLNIVTVSKWEKEIVRKSFLSKKNISSIYNWIDMKKFYPKTIKEKNSIKDRMGLKNKKIILGIAPYWTNQKGATDFFELAKRLPSEYLIIMIGKNPNKKLFDKNHIDEFPENILYIPWVSNDKLRDYYVIADIFLNLSRSETFGLTTIEAMACGTPCIVYDVTACPEIIGDDSNCGYIVHFDKNRIDKIVNLILKNSSNSEKFIDECNKRVVENYCKEKQLEKYTNLYYEIINKKRVFK